MGHRFAGLRLRGVSEPRGRVSFDYWRCVARHCTLALRVRTIRTCRTRGARLVPLTDRAVLRGVPSGRRSGALVLFTGSEQVRILAKGALARRAALALVAAPFPTSGGEIRSPLPSPVPWAIDEGLACPVR